MVHLLILLLSICLLTLGCEQEGIVKYNDCREIVHLQFQKGFRPIQHILTTFTCSYDRTTDNKHIIGGVCVAVESAVFHSECLKAYIYIKESDIQCGQHSHAMQDGKCYCDDGYMYDTVYRQCRAIAAETGTAGFWDVPNVNPKHVEPDFVAPVPADEIAAMRATLPAGVTRTDDQIASIIRHKREGGPTGGNVR